MQTRQYVARSRIAAPAERVFQWHEQPGAFERLVPPGEPVRLVSQDGGIGDGARAEILIGYPPLAIRWVAEHSAYIQDRQFCDTQIRGPFAFWRHTHVFEADGPDGCYLEDRVEYALPFGRLGGWLLGRLVERKLARLFAYRHRVTREANEAMNGAHERDIG